MISAARHHLDSVDDGDFLMIGFFSSAEYMGPDDVVDVDIPVKVIRGEIADRITQEKT